MAVNNFNYLISWSDFTQVPAKPPGTTEEAEIVLKFPQKYDYTIGRKGTIIDNVSVDIAIASPECWVVSSQATNMDLLKHEQGHYDITALGAREFHDGLVGLAASNENALNAKIKKLRNRIQQKINRANANYDTQTNHSLNTRAQQTWNNRISIAKRNQRGTIDELP